MSPDGIPIVTEHNDEDMPFQWRISMEGEHPNSKLKVEVGNHYVHGDLFGPEGDGHAMLREVGVRAAMKGLELVGFTTGQAYACIKAIVQTWEAGGVPDMPSPKGGCNNPEHNHKED